MKSLLSSFFAVLISFLCYSSLQAQVTSTFAYIDGYNACGQSTLNITLKNTSASDILPLFAEFKLNSAMSPTAFSCTLPASDYTMTVTGNTVKFSIEQLSANSQFDIRAVMTSSKPCALIGCGQFFATTDTLRLTHSNKNFFFYNAQALSSPCLTYDETEFTNRLTSAFLGDVVTRKLVLKNTGGGTFNGLLQLKDIFGPFVVVQSITSTTPGYTAVSNALTNDSTYLFQGNFTGIKNGDSIVIIEKVLVIKCIKADEGLSKISVNWSCGPGLCNEIKPNPIIAQVLKNKKKPKVVITKINTPESLCLNSKTKYLYKIKNEGTRPATRLDFWLESTNYDTYTYISKSSLELSDTAGMTLTGNSMSTLPAHVPIPLYRTFYHTCTIPDPLLRWAFSFRTLMPGDSFYVSAEGFQCCPGDDTSNVDLTFETWNLIVKYKDECEEEEFTTNSPPENKNILSLKQFYEPIITDMIGGPAGSEQTATFEIFNNSFSTDFYRLNESNASFKIKLKLDTGLVYVPNTLKIKSIYGYALSPTSEQLLPGAGVDKYQDNYLEAVFELPDTFRVDKLFFGRFMRNSSVFFDLTAVCPAKEPISRFTQEFYFIPDRSCTNACEILVSSVTTEIAVHCPGCVTPGWVGFSYKAQRLTLGEQDNDNNRLPDNLSYTPADRTKIKNNRCIPGDTIQTEFKAYIQDGDPVNGRDMNFLQNNNGADNFDFKYSYLRTDISFGKLFNLNSVKIYLSDATATGTQDSLTLPLSCVTKIPNPKDSASNAQFFFDLSLDTLYKYGLRSSYAYDKNDQIRIVCVYNILEPASLYLTNPPGTLDPWLLRENAAILLNSYNNLLFMTGSRVTASNQTQKDAVAGFREDPNSLDSTMLYWCEGYGAASTIVGKNRSVTFELPATVQCRKQAFIRINMNPSGGTFRNAFPFEYRNLLSIDSVRAFVPPGYRFMNWAITNVVQKPDGFLEYESCTFVDSLKNINEQGPVITIPINARYKKQTTFGSPCAEQLIYGDEEQSVAIDFYVQPDCDISEDTIHYTSPILYHTVGPSKLKYADQANTVFCASATNCKIVPIIPSLAKLNAALKLSPLTNEMQLSKQTFCYPVNIEETKGNDAAFSFLRVKSVHHKVKATRLTNKETGQVFLPDSTGLFKLDTTAGKAVYQYELCFDNICGQVIDRDTIRLVYGHDCFSYPNLTMTNICKRDSIEHYVTPASLAIQGFIQGPQTVKMCDAFDVVTTYEVTGVGKVDNLLLRLKSEGTTLQNATMKLNDDSGNILSLYDAQTKEFNLKQRILQLKPDGMEAGDKITFTLRYNTDCQYKGARIAARAVLITAACDSLYGDSLIYKPDTLTGYPAPDHKVISASFTEVKNTGGEVTATLNVHNNASVPTQNKTRITFLLPAGFTYLNMASGDAPTKLTDTSVVWELPTGITTDKELKTVFKNTTVSCDTILVTVLLGDLSIGCSNLPCVQRDTVYRQKVPVVCYPCPPTLTLSKRCKELPVFNELEWAYTPLTHCPADINFHYDLYYSPTVGGTYTLLTSTQDLTYTHSNITAYDGCYYVTVIDQQGLSSKSETVCKATCRDQFKCADLFIPNMVTPNKDGSNETFEITGAYTALKVEIYNAWGTTVYRSEDYKNDWDAKGLSDGVYYYTVHIDGSDEKCVGWIHVLGNK